MKFYNEGNDVYQVKKIKGPIEGIVEVPGSKSITNRALLMASIGIGKAHITGALFSDDSRVFLQCLKDLGFRLDVFEEEKIVDIIGMGGIIPEDNVTINVGAAGTAARFLTAMLGLSAGTYTIECAEQMKKRPMEELFKVLKNLGAEIEFLEDENHLPVKIKGCGLLQDRTYKRDRKDVEVIDIEMDISKSTQYLSALLMVAPALRKDVCIHVASEKKIGSYIKITVSMLKNFGVNIEVNEKEGTYLITGKKKPVVGNYKVEPDLSAACYFYGLAAITRGKVTVRDVHFKSCQGDLEFIETLEVMGCEIKDNPEGIEVSGPLHLHGVDVDMNNCSDQALTLAAIAPFCDSPVCIRNVGHIRGQECDRIEAIVTNLTNLSVYSEVVGDDIFIYPRRDGIAATPTTIYTFNDHRVSMAFAMVGIKVDGIVIDDPLCCSKTFEDYYEVFEELIYPVKKYL